jgi:hypothetical protein
MAADSPSKTPGAKSGASSAISLLNALPGPGMTRPPFAVMDSVCSYICLQCMGESITSINDAVQNSALSERSLNGGRFSRFIFQGHFVDNFAFS